MRSETITFRLFDARGSRVPVFSESGNLIITFGSTYSESCAVCQNAMAAVRRAFSLLPDTPITTDSSPPREGQPRTLLVKDETSPVMEAAVPVIINMLTNTLAMAGVETVTVESGDWSFHRKIEPQID